MSNPALLPVIATRVMDPKFIAEIAAGMDNEEEIAARYGFSEAQWEVIRELEEFQLEVSRVRAEFKRDGQMSRYKARMMSNELMDQVFVEALDPDTPMSAKLDALKVFTNLADMTPKTSQKADTGPKFSINITLPPAGPTPVEIHSEEEVIEYDAECDDMEDK